MRRSDTIAQLSSALSKAQGAIKAAAKDAENPHFRSRYADLASVWEACRGPLATNELAVIQLPSVSDGQVHVVTLLTHSSGEWIEETLDLTPGNETPQGVGSAITYGRRYGLSAMVGVAPDDDDDGNGASQGQNQQRANGQRTNTSSRPSQARPATAADRFITPAEKDELAEVARVAGWKGDALQNHITNNYGGWSKIPFSKFSQVTSELRDGVEPVRDSDVGDDAPLPVEESDIPF